MWSKNTRLVSKTSKESGAAEHMYWQLMSSYLVIKSNEVNQIADDLWSSLQTY